MDGELGGLSVPCFFKNAEDGIRWVFSGVYGLVVDNLRLEMLGRLACLAFSRKPLVDRG